MAAPHLLPLSKRGRNAPPSPIRKLAPLAQQAMARGTRIYHLNIGQPDISTPAQFFEGLGGVQEKVLAYEPSRGNEQLCLEWSRWMNEHLQLSTTPEQFLITFGASEALLYALAAVCDPGDEVLVFDPCYGNYLGLAAQVGVTLRGVPCTLDDDFAIPSVVEVAQYLGPRTRALLLCNPNNPTGRVYGEQELRQLLDLCHQHRLFLFVDEAYREFVYDGMTPRSILHLAPSDPCVVVLDSLSKRFSLCGARIGCLLTSNEELLGAVGRMAQARLAAPTLEQRASAFLLQQIGWDFIAAVQHEYQMRRDTLCRALRRIPGVELTTPQGAFYALVRLPVADAEQFARFLLQEFSVDGATTFLAPAAGFYVNPGRGMNETRIAYVLNCAELERAATCIASGLEAFEARQKRGAA